MCQRMGAFLLFGLIVSVGAADMTANPIRKVVGLMQNMQKEIEAEGAKEQAAYDKFMCYCSGNNGDLEASAAKARATIEELTAQVSGETAEKAQAEQDLAQHKSDREGAEKDRAESTMLRGKESAEYDETSADLKSNIAGMASAIPALEKGMGGASLMQLPQGALLQKLVGASRAIDEMDRKNVLAFLEQSGDYVPQSGQIVGILKNMKDEMESSLAKAVSDDAQAKAGFAELKASKDKEVEIATEAIEAKSSRSGGLAVSIAQGKDALEDTQTELADTEAFAQTLKEQCGTKEQEWTARKLARSEEISAISQAIEILNDDDALDVFKKAIPASLVQSPTFGFLQQKDGKAAQLQRVQSLLASGTRYHTPQMDLLLFSLRSKLHQGLRQGLGQFQEVVAMVDSMIMLLSKNQQDDVKQSDWCHSEFNKSGDEEAASKAKMTGLNAALSEQTDEITQLAEEIAALQGEVKALDKSVAEATAQRKDDHASYDDMVQLTGAAVQLIGKAKNRLQKFYNPALYHAAPKTERSAEEKIIDAGSFVQIHAHDSVAPGAAPDTFSGSVQKSSKSAGVLGLMDMIVKEMQGEAKEAEHEETTAQKDYAKLIAASQAMRGQNSKSIVDKSAAKADLEGMHMSTKESRVATATDIDQVQSYVQDLHASCDFIMQNFDLRKEARSTEVESLKNAKAVLSGASFAL